MKQLTDYLLKKEFLFRDLHSIDPIILGVRKKIKIYSGCDLRDHFIAIFVVSQKSRFVLKTTLEFGEIQSKLALHEGHNFKKTLLLLKAPLCSKAKIALESKKWIIYNDFM